ETEWSSTRTSASGARPTSTTPVRGRWKSDEEPPSTTRRYDRPPSAAASEGAMVRVLLTSSGWLDKAGGLSRQAPLMSKRSRPDPATVSVSVSVSGVGVGIGVGSEPPLTLTLTTPTPLTGKIGHFGPKAGQDRHLSVGSARSTRSLILSLALPMALFSHTKQRD